MTAIATGTASDFADLYDRLLDFATGHADLVAAGEEWTLDLDSGGEAILHGPGLAGQDAIYCGIKLLDEPTYDRYNWRLLGATGYQASNGWTLQPGADTSQRIYLWDQGMAYWLVGSGRRLIVVAKVSSVYQVAYLGLALPYATPSQYPYPLVIGGMGTANQRWSDGGRALWAPESASLRWRDPAGAWLAPSSPQVYRGGMSGFSSWREAPDGTRVLVPVVCSMNGNVLGELDGIACVPGWGIGSEDLVTWDGDDWLVVQDATRTGTDDYAAVRLS